MFAIEFLQSISDITVRLLRLIRRRGLSRTDGPYGLICHYIPLKVDVLEAISYLHLQNIISLSGLSLAEGFSDAKDNDQTVLMGNLYLLVHRLVRLAEILPSLRMADN